MSKSLKLQPVLISLALFFFSISFSVSKADANVLTLSDQELATQFSIAFGTAGLTITDVPGLGVEFTATNIGSYQGSYKLGITDNFELSPLAGGTGSHNADFTAFSSYQMAFKNTGNSNVSVNLFMNTGFTGSSGDPDADTFWGGSWISLSPGEIGIATLDFSYAETWGAENDPVVSWRYTNGTWNPIFRLTEVTNIGFQVIADNTSATIVVSSVPIPSALFLFSSGIIGLWGYRKKFSF